MKQKCFHICIATNLDSRPIIFPHILFGPHSTFTWNGIQVRVCTIHIRQIQYSSQPNLKQNDNDNADDDADDELTLSKSPLPCSPTLWHRMEEREWLTFWASQLIHNSHTRYDPSPAYNNNNVYYENEVDFIIFSRRHRYTIRSPFSIQYKMWHVDACAGACACVCVCVYPDAFSFSFWAHTHYYYGKIVKWEMWILPLPIIFSLRVHTAQTQNRMFVLVTVLVSVWAPAVCVLMCMRWP